MNFCPHNEEEGVKNNRWERTVPLECFGIVVYIKNLWILAELFKKTDNLLRQVCTVQYVN